MKVNGLTERGAVRWIGAEVSAGEHATEVRRGLAGYVTPPAIHGAGNVLEAPGMGEAVVVRVLISADAEVIGLAHGDSPHALRKWLINTSQAGHDLTISPAAALEEGQHPFSTADAEARVIRPGGSIALQWFDGKWWEVGHTSA